MDGNRLTTSTYVVISQIAEESRCKFKEPAQLVIWNSQRMTKVLPISITRVVQLDDEVKDRFRLGGHLSKDDPRTQPGSSKSNLVSIRIIESQY
jgi:hypothetical protein